MFDEKVYTLPEISQHLRIPEDVVRKEIAAGHLAALDIAGFLRVRESDLDSYLNARISKGNVKASAKHPVQKEDLFQLSKAADFDYVWPAPAGETKTVERYTDVREGLASYGGKQYKVKVGFTHRNSAGRKRLRCLVQVDRYATAEFVAADDKKGGKMAAIIRDRLGKQLPVGAPTPPEYQDLPVAPYSEVVVGPRASTGLAVVCESNDFATMIKHALIRYRFREERDS